MACAAFGYRKCLVCVGSTCMYWYNDPNESFPAKEETPDPMDEDDSNRPFEGAYRK